MQNNVIYYRENDNIKYIYYNNSTQSYPMHTHVSHIMVGYITNGAVRIIYGNQECIYHEGEYFCIMPDIPHALESVKKKPYSMITLCIYANKMMSKAENRTSYFMRLKQTILNEPESTFSIESMANSVNISPYHMIRQFKVYCGLTPHQFQIQCRIRKAQKMLEEGKSVIEVACATGFCDQSHFDRCFCKIVRLTPSNYKKAIRCLD